MPLAKVEPAPPQISWAEDDEGVRRMRRARLMIRYSALGLVALLSCVLLGAGLQPSSLVVWLWCLACVGVPGDGRRLWAALLSLRAPLVLRVFLVT